MYVNSAAFPPIAGGYYETAGLRMLPETITGAPSLASQMGGGGIPWDKLGMLGMQMQQQPEQQRPQHAPPLYRPQPISLQELMQRYGLLA